MQIGLSEHFTYRKLFRFVLPTIVMMIITSVYSIVDGFFVSNFVGKTEFAAVNLVTPVLMALGSFGFMIGTGGSALVANTMGEKKDKLANEYFSMLIYVEAAVGIIASVIGIAFMPQIAELLGAEGHILDSCVLYGRTLLFGNVFFMLQNSFQSFLVTAEKPKMGLVISVSSGVCNMVLDYVLIKYFDMGLFGAALATTIAQVVGGIVPLIYFIFNRHGRLRLVKTKINFRAIGKACANGSSEMLTNLSASFVGALYNIRLLDLAGENGVAAYGVIMYVSFIFSAFYFGYSIGSGPVIGFNNGAGNREELHNMYHKSMVIISAAAVIMTAMGVGLSGVLAGIFVGYDPELLEMTSYAMKIYSISFLMSGFNVFGSAMFTALNNGLISALISFMRTLVIQSAAILILPIFFDVSGIWFAISAAEAVTLIITFTFIVKYRKRYGY